MGLEVISNPKISRFKILGDIVKSKSLTFLKLSKQGIWILIIQIQIRILKSCHPNTPLVYYYLLKEIFF